jgi:molybdate transport system substrate-binding protein
MGMRSVRAWAWSAVFGTVFGLGTVFGAPGPAVADTLQVAASGSLRGALTDLIAASGIAASDIAPPVYGAGGLLRHRIEAGELHADLFASADTAQPGHLARDSHYLPVIAFARNQMCLVSRASLGVTADTTLDQLLDPAVRLATSTPGDDPGGDWAEAVFDRAEALHPGARALLDAKALRLPGKATTVPGHGMAASIFLGNQADAMLSYCTGAPAVLKEVPDVTVTPLPASLEVRPTNGLTVLASSPEAMRLALFILSEPGQAILAKHKFLPVGSP